MLVEQVATLFRDYCDEPDTTFLTNANVSEYLRIGYSKFRDIVIAANPEFYAIRQDFTLSNQDEFDLGPSAAAPIFKIMGQNTVASPLTAPRLQHIVNLIRTDGTGDRVWYLRPVGNLEQMEQISNDNNRYCIINKKLFFKYNSSGTYRLWYVPADDFITGLAGSGVDWTTGITAGSDVFIDDLHPYHDLIALLAYKQYAIRDGAVSPIIDAQIRDRTKALEDYITQGINLAANQVVHVQNETWY